MGEGKKTAQMARSGSAIAAGVLFVILLSALFGCGNDQPAASDQRQMPPPPVTVMEVSAREVAVEGRYPGRVQGSREVEVRARVGGIIEQRLYKEGAEVAAGEPLFLIDPQPYAIALRRAQAEEALAQAELEDAARERQRGEELYQQDAISERERDQARTNHKLAQARLELTRAALADARRNLGYTRVKAPIAGVTGLETLSEGSLIKISTLLTTITQADPVQVRFSLPEAEAVQRRRNLASSPPEKSELFLRATLVPPNDYSHSRPMAPGLPGLVDFTDHLIDPQTGTMELRAVFSNPEAQLLPGQMVRVTLLLELLEEAFLIPPTALVNDRSGPRVYIVQPDNTVAARPVSIGPLVDGKRVITSGLQEGELLVINGQVSLAPGMKVQPTNSPEIVTVHQGQ